MGLYTPKSNQFNKKQNEYSVSSVKETKKLDLFRTRRSEGFGFGRFGVARFGQTAKHAISYKKKLS